MHIFAILFLLFALFPLPASAYVGPGLIIMGNILGPFILLLPFLLLLLVLLARWWFKKIKHQKAQKKMAENQANKAEDENTEK